MERDAERPRQLDQFLCALNVHAAVGVEDAHDNPIGPQLLGGYNVASHGLELFRRVIKVASARPNHDLQADGCSGPHEFNQTRAGSYPALEQVAAQFHASGPATLGGD